MGPRFLLTDWQPPVAGPLRLQRHFDIEVIPNNFTWANNFNILFVDQPVGTGLTYADTTNSNPFVTSMDRTSSPIL